jgi:hypothetical protein
MSTLTNVATCSSIFCISTEAKVYLTDGDLPVHSILVKGFEIIGILDRETAGYYPEF